MQKKLSILFFGQTPPPYHGVSVMNRTLLSSRFTEVFEVALIETNFAGKIDDLGKFNFSKAIRLAGYVFQTFKVLLSRHVDLICFPINFTQVALLRDMVLLLPVKLFGKRIIFYTHGNNLPAFRAAASPVMRYFIDFTIRLGDAAILVGENLRFNYAGYLPDERVLSVHHGVERFKIPMPVDSRRTDTHSRMRVLYLSNLIVTKGFLVVLHAIPKVVRQFQDITFVFGGEWDMNIDREAIDAFIAEHHIESYIEWRGRVVGEAKERLYEAADIFTFPTFYPLETFGIVNLEAMQAGLPVITTGRAAIPEVILDGENGFIIPEQNADALAEKILLLCRDAPLRAKMRENNLRRFEEFYTKEKYAERMITAIEVLYRKLS